MGDEQGFADRVSPQIQEVIEAELMKDGGGMLTGFIGLFTYIDGEGNQCWSRVGEVPMIQGVGMVDLLHSSVLRDAQRHMGFRD